MSRYVSVWTKTIKLEGIRQVNKLGKVPNTPQHASRGGQSAAGCPVHFRSDRMEYVPINPINGLTEKDLMFSN